MGTETEIKAATTLEALPPEILCQIVENLCSHCSPELHADSSDFLHKAAGVRALVALTKTSQILRSVALPILFHRPDDHVSLMRLVRILLQQPELGPHVREARVSMLDGENAVVACFNQVALNLIHGAGRSLDSSQADEEGLGFRVINVAVLVALAPKIERLAVGLHHFVTWPAETDFSYLAKRLGRVGDGTGLESLRRLKVSHVAGAGVSPSNPALLALISAAVNLEYLEFDRASGLPFRKIEFDVEKIKVTCRSLKTVEFSQCVFDGISADSDFGLLCEMLRCASNLEAFKFTAAPEHVAFAYEPLMPNDFLVALQSVKKTLKHLRLDFADVYPTRNRIQLSNLVPFRNLQVLDISLGNPCSCSLSNAEDGGLKVAKGIAEMMPPSVKRLRLRIGVRTKIGCPDCIVGLGTKATVVSAIALRSLEIHRADYLAQYSGSISREDELLIPIFESYRKAFEGSHVSLHFRGRFFAWVRDSRLGRLGWMDVETSEIESI